MQYRRPGFLTYSATLADMALFAQSRSQTQSLGIEENNGFRWSHRGARTANRYRTCPICCALRLPAGSHVTPAKFMRQRAASCVCLPSMQQRPYVPDSLRATRPAQQGAAIRLRTISQRTHTHQLKDALQTRHCTNLDRTLPTSVVRYTSIRGSL